MPSIIPPTDVPEIVGPSASAGPPDSRDYRILGKAFWSLAHRYSLTREEQAILLGVKHNNARLGSLEKKGAIPEDPDKAVRVGHLLGIHQSLRIMYPGNRDLVYKWLKIPRQDFGSQSALKWISGGADSMARLFTVRRYLDVLRVGLGGA